jgi:hypothetical protein
MPPIIMLQTVEARLIAERDGEARVNVIHFRYSTSGVTGGQLAQLASDIEDVIIDAQEDMVVVGTTWNSIEVQDMAVPNGLQHVRSINRQGVGGLQVMPGNVSFVLSKKTAQSGRSFQGRFYLFDMGEDFFNGSLLNPSYIDSVDALAAALLQPLASNAFVPAVGSRLLQGSTPITSIVYNDVVDTQRRRVPGVGA